IHLQRFSAWIVRSCLSFLACIMRNSKLVAVPEPMTTFPDVHVCTSLKGIYAQDNHPKLPVNIELCLVTFESIHNVNFIDIVDSKYVAENRVGQYDIASLPSLTTRLALRSRSAPTSTECRGNDIANRTGLTYFETVSRTD